MAEFPFPDLKNITTKINAITQTMPINDEHERPAYHEHTKDKANDEPVVVDIKIDSKIDVAQEQDSELDISTASHDAVSNADNNEVNNSQNNDLLINIINKISDLEKNMHNIQHNLALDCAELAYTIAQKINTELEKYYTADSMCEFLSKSLHKLFDVAAINIKVHPDILPGLEEMRQSLPHADKLRFVGDSSIAKSDCNVEWEGGAVMRNKDAVLQEIESTLTNYMSHKRI